MGKRVGWGHRYTDGLAESTQGMSGDPGRAPFTLLCLLHLVLPPSRICFLYLKAPSYVHLLRPHLPTVLSTGAGGIAGSRRRPREGVSPDGPVGGVGVPRRHHADQGAHLRVLLHLQEAGGRLELGGLVHVGHGHAHDRLVAESAQVSEAGVHELVEGLQDHSVHGLGLKVQVLRGGSRGPVSGLGSAQAVTDEVREVGPERVALAQGTY